MKKILGILLAVSTPLWAANFPPAQYDGKMKWILAAGLQGGGDALQSVVDVSTGDTVEKLRAGGYFALRVGAVLPLGEQKNWSLETTVGYLYDEISSNINVNDNAKFERTTVEVIPFYNFGRHRIGIGLTYHISPKFEQTASVGNLEVEFDDALGGVVQYDVRYDKWISAGIRAGFIQYDYTGGSVDAPFFGIHLNYEF
jgi:hypothetical protein